MSRAHLEQGRVRAPPGEGSAPRGGKGAAWVGGTRQLGPRPIVDRDSLPLLPRRRRSVQPAAPMAAPLARAPTRGRPGARRAARCPPPRPREHRHRGPAPGRSETGAGTRPESDGAAGPIARRSGSLGGGAEAARGPGGAGSLREALPRGGPAGGGEVPGPQGARPAGAKPGREGGPAAEARGARRRAGPGRLHPTPASGPGGWGFPPASSERFPGGRGTSRAHLGPARSPGGLAPRGCRRGQGLRGNPGPRGLWTRVFSTNALFLPQAGIPPAPRSAASRGPQVRSGDPRGSAQPGPPSLPPGVLWSLRILPEHPLPLSKKKEKKKKECASPTHSHFQMHFPHRSCHIFHLKKTVSCCQPFKSYI